MIDKILLLILSTVIDFGLALTNGDEKLVRDIMKASQLETLEQNRMLFSIIKIESDFRPRVVSPKKAVGLMQLTRPAVIDAARECNLSEDISTENLKTVYTNVNYGTCYLKKLLRERKGNWIEVLIIYNGGYRQLTRYLKGDSVVLETERFVMRVLSVYLAEPRP